VLEALGHDGDIERDVRLHATDPGLTGKGGALIRGLRLALFERLAGRRGGCIAGTLGSSPVR